MSIGRSVPVLQPLLNDRLVKTASVAKGRCAMTIERSLLVLMSMSHSGSA